MLTRYVVLSDWSTFEEVSESLTGPPYLVVLGKKGRKYLVDDFKEVPRKECKRIFSLNNPNHLRTLASMLEHKKD
jgi:predicted metal-dependent phosphoesterase TrpH